MTPQQGEEFAEYWARAVDERIDWMPVKVISCADQLARLKRSAQEKHKRDVVLLTAACPGPAPADNKPQKTRSRRGK